MKKNIYAVILAGGKGTRFQSQLPKQLHKINNKTVLDYSIDTFIRTGIFQKIIVVTPGEWMQSIQNSRKDMTLIQGGATRTESLKNGVDHIDSICSHDNENIVVTHDAARPLVTPDLICECVSAMDKYDACTVAMPSRDSLIYSVNGEYVDSCPDRSNYMQVQTPQVFKLDLFNKIINNYNSSDFERITEIGQIFVENGYRVGIIEGNRKNMKITDKEDLDIIKSLI